MSKFENILEDIDYFILHNTNNYSEDLEYMSFDDKIQIVIAEHIKQNRVYYRKLLFEDKD